jgi:protein-S-isoprenylcysteine O-methyltransferase Ste14
MSLAIGLPTGMRFDIHHFPSLCIGLLMLAYWLRVMVMVRRIKRETGHGANFRPPERLGRILRIIWAPVVLLWIFLPIATAFLADPPALLRPLHASHAVAWIAFALALVAFGLTVACWIEMGRNWRMGIDPNEKTALVCTGPFAYVRNPIYGLSILLMIFTMIIVASPAMIVVGILHIILMRWEVAREEAYLFSVHGDAYADYRDRVGRFFPRSLRPYAPR